MRGELAAGPVGLSLAPARGDWQQLLVMGGRRLDNESVVRKAGVQSRRHSIGPMEWEDKEENNVF